MDRTLRGPSTSATPRGIRVSHDRGVTWQRRRPPACTASTPGHPRGSRRERESWSPGNEEGIFRSEDGGTSWRTRGRGGLQVLHVEQSPHDPCYWLAAHPGRRPVRLHRLRRQLRKQRQPGRRPEPLRHRVRSRRRRTHRGGWLGHRRGHLARIAAKRGSRATPAARHVASGASLSTRRSPAASTPACTRRRSTFPTTTAAPGARTAWRAARLSHEVRAGGAADEARLLCSCSSCRSPRRARHPDFAERAQSVIEAYAHPQDRGPARATRTSRPSSGCMKTPRCARAARSNCSPTVPPATCSGCSRSPPSPTWIAASCPTRPARPCAARCKTYMPYRGDTENHWLLYYTSPLPDGAVVARPGRRRWYTGKISAENLREAAGLDRIRGCG